MVFVQQPYLGGRRKEGLRVETPAGTGGKGWRDRACQSKQCPFKIIPGVDHVLRNVAESLFLPDDQGDIHISNLITDRMAHTHRIQNLGCTHYCNLATLPMSSLDIRGLASRPSHHLQIKSQFVCIACKALTYPPRPTSPLQLHGPPPTQTLAGLNCFQASKSACILLASHLCKCSSLHIFFLLILPLFPGI